MLRESSSCFVNVTVHRGVKVLPNVVAVAGIFKLFPFPMGDSLALARQATAKDQVKATGHLAWNLGTIFVIGIMETNFGSKQILLPRNETILKRNHIQGGTVLGTGCSILGDKHAIGHFKWSPVATCPACLVGLKIILDVGIVGMASWVGVIDTLEGWW